MNEQFALCPMPEAVRRMNAWGEARQPFVFVVNYACDAAFVELMEDVNPAVCRYDFRGKSNIPLGESPVEKHDIRWLPHPMSEAEYAKAFEVVHRNLLAGNSFLTNLTCKVPVDTNLSLEEIFCRVHAPYRLWVKDKFVCFSPEIFVRIHDGRISTYPMKGTIDATLPDARSRLLEDGKEAAEHATIVDLLRNDLSRYATQVTVRRYRYFDRLTTHRGALWQTSSEIEGRLPDDYRRHLGDILSDMLPAGSVTGAPKKKTLDIIAEAEDYDRGFYTGVAGWFDGDNVDSCVLIRFVEQEGGQLYFKAGGGITFQSDMHSEYEEMKQKIYVPIY